MFTPLAFITRHNTHNAARRLRIATLAMFSVFILLLTACSGAGPASSGNGKKTVLTTFTVLADIAKNVAGDHLNVESLTKPGAEIHEYEPTPSDIKKAHSADLILDNGLNLETWFAKFVQEANAPHATVSEGVTPMNISEDAYAGKPNPHAWMSPKNVQKYVDNMVTEFSKLDPDHAEDFKKNAENYKRQLQDVQDELSNEVRTLPENQRALVTCEGAFSYLAADAGLKEKYIWAVNSEQQATPSQINSAIDSKPIKCPPYSANPLSRTTPCSRWLTRPAQNLAGCSMWTRSQTLTGRYPPTWR